MHTIVRAPGHCAAGLFAPTMAGVRALILDPGNSRSALAGCRALGRAGWVVGVAGPPTSVARRSRWCRWYHRVPAPEADGAAFVAAVADAVRAGGYDVVLPAGDAEAVALSAGRADIAAAVPYPAHDVVVRAFDKVALARVAADAGVRTPDTAADRFPVVVKARSHAGGRCEAAVVTTPAELDAALARVAATGGDALVQSFVAGDLVAVAAVVDKAGAVVAEVHQRASRTWPLPAGVSTRAETVDPVPAVAAAATAVLDRLGWFGLVQLQFLLGDDGDPCLIDCNGRLYGSLALAEAAGVNLPATWARIGMGLPVDTVKAAAGHRYQWLEGDLRRALEERRGGVARDLLATVAYGLRARHSILSADDPTPAALYAAALARRAAAKARR